MRSRQSAELTVDCDRFFCCDCPFTGTAPHLVEPVLCELCAEENKVALLCVAAFQHACCRAMPVVTRTTISSFVKRKPAT